MKKIFEQKRNVLALLMASVCVCMTACGESGQKAGNAAESVTEQEEADKVNRDYTVDLEIFDKGKYSAGISVHDPSVVRAGDKYYIVGSHMTMAYTSDLEHWAYSGNGYSSVNKVFGSIFTDETGEIFSFTGKKESVVPTDDKKCHVWAPDIIYNRKKGLYYMYYCTSSTWNASTLEYATSETIDGKYEYAGTILSSGFNGVNYDKTNILEYVDKADMQKTYLKPDHSYNYSLWPNAIDPTAFYDKEGRMWLVYGSWSGGIFLLELDEETGNAIHPESDPASDTDPYFGKKLLGGGHKSIEGPYILYDPESDYYYLYVSYGELTADGGYQIRVFRSREVDGEYTDMKGNRPGYLDTDHAGFGLKLSGNYRLPSLENAYKATGHNSALIDEDGKKFLVYHSRFESRGEYHEPRVKQYFLNKEGWPVLLPYMYQGETIEKNGYTSEEITGRYYVVAQGTSIDASIAEPVVFYLDGAGSVYTLDETGAEVQSSYTLQENSPYMTITLGDITYSGVFCRQTDEAGNEVMVFTAVGENAGLWGVKYDTITR